MSGLIERLIDLAVQIQSIPAPTFAEKKRAQVVKELFSSEGLHDISIDKLHNVFARLPGVENGRPIIVSAHLDTVFPIETDLSTTIKKDRIIGPGIGDNSLGVASLIGLIWLLREQQISLPTDLWLVANSCEEGLGDLRGMRAVVERFGAEAAVYLVIEGLSLGFIQHRALGVQRYRITAETRGGHSWSDYGQPSAINELAKLVTKLTDMTLSKDPRTTMNVGRMAGGTSINSIASQAWLELDLRSEDPGELAELARVVEDSVRTASRPDTRIEAEVIGSRPAGEIAEDHRLVRLAEDCLKAQGLKPKSIIGSTDANVPLSRGYPAVVLGVTSGAGAHTSGEYIYTRPVKRGMQQLAQFVCRVGGDD